MITFTYKNKTFALISDTHGWHKKILVPKCDFLIHCGGFCVNGNENQIIGLEGICFYGLVSDYNLTKIPELSNKPIGFLLSHVPPKAVLDEGIGCPILLQFVKLQKPKHHLFGHIHSFGQQTQILNETVFINCCCFTAI